MASESYRPIPYRPARVEAEESTLRVTVQYLIRRDESRHSETFVRGGVT